MPAKFLESLRALALTAIPDAVLAGLLAGLLAPSAHAQLSGSAGLLSNYMYRGITLSADKPAARLALNYDAANGLYAGGQVISGQLATETHRAAQWIGYAGYAQRLASGLAWEAGVTHYAFSSSPDWDFSEIYAGISGEKIGLRLHYAPDYLGFGERTLYAEMNGGMVLAERLHFFWHGGYLHSFTNARRSRAEARFGFGAAHQGWQAQLSLDLTRLRGDSGNPYTREAERMRHEIVLSLARTF